jgi:hypothetical protein
MSKPVFDVVVFGASSFVGQILCAYLASRFGTGKDAELTWAAAGRSESKLRSLKESLGPAASKLTLIQADSNDEAALRALCAQARVVVTTVGPYALYGETLVRVCAETGTDYCDLTGETPWIKRMIDTYEATAKKSGARLVHCCGFDSIPSDLGVWFLQQQADKRQDAGQGHARRRLGWDRRQPHERRPGSGCRPGAAQDAGQSLLDLPTELCLESKTAFGSRGGIRPGLRRLVGTICDGSDQHKNRFSQ